MVPDIGTYTFHLLSTMFSVSVYVYIIFCLCCYDAKTKAVWFVSGDDLHEGTAQIGMTTRGNAVVGSEITNKKIARIIVLFTQGDA
jgi:hypothetical protein